MEQTKLIQRLTAPRTKGLGIGNPFSFGAGGGGFSEKAMELLAPVLRFDYMMAAEYEFGAVPGGLHKIYEHASANNLFFDTLNIKIKDVKLDTSHLNQELRTWKSHPVYIIGPAREKAEVVRRVNLIATDEDRCLADMWQKFKGKLHEGLYIRDDTRLNRYLKLVPGHDDPTVGWLELENGFFFSVDPVMTEKFAALFGLLIEIKTAQL